MRGYIVLPIAMPSTMAKVSALIPFDCSQPSWLSRIAANAMTPVNARPGHN
jgi:hypothetical protein